MTLNTVVSTVQSRVFKIMCLASLRKERTHEVLITLITSLEYHFAVLFKSLEPDCPTGPTPIRKVRSVENEMGPIHELEIPISQRNGSSTRVLGGHNRVRRKIEARPFSENEFSGVAQGELGGVGARRPQVRAGGVSGEAEGAGGGDLEGGGGGDGGILVGGPD